MSKITDTTAQMREARTAKSGAETGTPQIGTTSSNDTRYVCGPWELPSRSETLQPRRALVELPCIAAENVERTKPEQVQTLDLLRIAHDAFAYSAAPRLYGSRFARNQAEATRANAAIAALMAHGALPTSPAPTPSPAPVKDIVLGGAGIVAAGVMLPALMQLFDRNAVDRDSHLKRLEFIRSRYLPGCRDTLLKLRLEEALKLFEQAVDPVEFSARTSYAPAVSNEVYREIARQCSLGLRALFAAVRDAPEGDHAAWAVEAEAFPQAPAAQVAPVAYEPAAAAAAAAAESPPARNIARKRAAPRRGKTK